MPNQITLPAGNTQTSQRKNALAHSATDTTAHTPTQKLQDELETLKDQHYDAMALSLERIECYKRLLMILFMPCNLSNEKPIST